VALAPTARGLRTGVYMGWDGDRPTRQLDALVHEIDPGVTTTIHRHSWDAILFVVEGSGWTEVDGVRYDWKAWDAIHLPAWSWHRHGNESDKAARFMSYSSEPTLWTLGMSVLEDAGHRPFAELAPRPPVSPGWLATIPMRGGCGASRSKRRTALGTHPYAVRRAGDPRHAARHADEVPQRSRHWQPGIRPDAGDDSVCAWQNTVAHRHPGEAWLYVVEGYGHSFMGIAPDNGEHHRWKKGDLIIVDHYLWHQHFNDDPVNQCRLVRIHMFDSLLETMRAVMDPMVLFEEAEDTLVSMQELSQIQWPDDKRPGE
jgi:gentisate 1,2-dioxygenase